MVTQKIYLSDIDYEISSPTMLNRQPLVSVLILAYNHGNYIKQAIDGVLAQIVEFPIEVLIGEDCSTDDTLEVTLQYQRQHPNLIRIISADTNVGLQRNWQRLLSAGRGEFLAHLDGDDYWLPDKLSVQVTYLQQHPECAAIYTNAITVEESGRNVGLFNDVGEKQFGLAELLYSGNFLNTSSMVFRAKLRHLLLEIDNLFIDYRVHLRLARFGYLMQLNLPLTVYRVNSIGAMTSTSNDIVRNLYWEAILDVPRELISDDDFAHGITNFLRRVLSRALRTRRWQLVRKWVPIVFKASPYGVVRTASLTIASAIRATYLEILGMFKRQPDGRRVPIRHRR